MAEENLIFYNLRSCAKSHSYVKLGTNFRKRQKMFETGKKSRINVMSEGLVTYIREVRKG